MSGRSFRFPLSPVLQLRERAVEAAREALGAARADRQRAEDALAQAEAALAAHGGVAGGQTAHRLQTDAAHRAHLARTRTDAGRALGRLRDAEGQSQRALAAAVRGREALAVLRDQAADAHRADALRAETQVLDDAALAGRRLRAAALS